MLIFASVQAVMLFIKKNKIKKQKIGEREG